jgi:hypothetical protein
MENLKIKFQKFCQLKFTTENYIHNLNIRPVLNQKDNSK